MLKLYLLGGLLLAGLLAWYVARCHGNSLQLAELQQRQQEWVAERTALNRELVSRNDRIKAMNEAQLAVIAAAREQMDAAQQAAVEYRWQRDAITRRLAELQQENRDDEQVVVLEQCPVPAVAWQRLRDLARADDGP